MGYRVRYLMLGPTLRPDAKMEVPLQFELIIKNWKEA